MADNESVQPTNDTNEVKNCVKSRFMLIEFI